MPRMSRRVGLSRGVLAAVAVAAGVAPAMVAGAAGRAPAGGEPVTIDWWHIQNNDPGMTDWQNMADAFTAEHPNVTVNITVMENEAFKAAIQTNVQAGDVPDLFQSWGGGVLLDQVEAGAVQDITEAAAPFIDALSEGAASPYNIDGVQYGLPFNQSLVGIWYNVDLFEQAGITETPTTWAGLLDVIQTLKDAGITPIAVGAGDKWPAHFWYSYLMVRIGGAEVMNQIAADNNFSVPAVVEAGERVAELVALEPFQDGFLGAVWDAPDGESGVMASQGAAMDLMGQWALGAFRNQAGLADSPEEALPFRIGWFPFPEVEGGAGLPTDGFGGVDGFIVGADAPPETVEFLGYITNAENQRTWALSGSGIPANIEATAALTEAPAPDGPNLEAILEALTNSTFQQQFLDQFFTAETGAAVNDQTALLFAGEATPEEAAEAITAVATGA
jgi:raffinose/stachyose/melibiose transport system substrate-binding protein